MCRLGRISGCIAAQSVLDLISSGKQSESFSFAFRTSHSTMLSQQVQLHKHDPELGIVKPHPAPHTISDHDGQRHHLAGQCPPGLRPCQAMPWWPMRDWPQAARHNVMEFHLQQETLQLMLDVDCVVPRSLSVKAVEGSWGSARPRSLSESDRPTCQYI